MKKFLALCALLIATPAIAKPVYTECVFADGSDFYIAAANGTVAVKWGKNADWNQAFARVDGVMVVITQLGANGVIVIGWNMDTKAAYVVMKDDRNGKTTESHARCWIK